MGGSSFGGATGVFRLFQSEFGGQVSWLIPAALISLGALLWISRRAPRTSRVRSFALLWGGWLLVTGVVFSYMQGIIHPYYMVALAPAIGALVGVGAISLLQSGLSIAGPGGRRGRRARHRDLGVRAARADARVAAVAAVDRAAGGRARRDLGLRRAGTAAGWTGRNRAGRRRRRRRRAPGLVYAPMALAIVAGLGGPLAYSLDTANSTHTGSIPSAGPTVAGSFGGGRAARLAAAARRRLRRPAAAPEPGRTAEPAPRRPGRGALPPAPAARLPAPAARRPGPAGPASGGFPGGSGSSPAGRQRLRHRLGQRRLPAWRDRAVRGGGVAMGGLSGSTQVSSALITLLEQDASKYKWIAATVGTQEAAPVELATGGDAVLAIGGFNGTDPSPTLAEFEALVAKGEIHYYLGENTETFGGGTGSSAITSWVAAHFKSETVGGVTVYNLTQEK